MRPSPATPSPPLARPENGPRPTLRLARHRRLAGQQPAGPGTAGQLRRGWRQRSRQRHAASARHPTHRPRPGGPIARAAAAQPPARGGHGEPLVHAGAERVNSLAEVPWASLPPGAAGAPGRWPASPAPVSIAAQGTAERPITLRAADPAQPPVLRPGRAGLSRRRPCVSVTRPHGGRLALGRGGDPPAAATTSACWTAIPCAAPTWASTSAMAPAPACAS